jgi:hypothetical protein
MGRIFGGFGGSSEISAQITENFGGVVLGVGPGPGFYHPAVCSDEDGNPCSPFLIGAFGGAVSKGNRAISIIQEIGCQAGFANPCFQILRGTEGDAQQCGVFVSEVLGSVTEPLSFFGSTAAKGAGKKPDQHVFPRIIRKTDAFPILIG